MARTLTVLHLLVCATALSACASAPPISAAEAVPTMANQKLLADVVAAAFARVDGLSLRNVVAGKNVAVRIATTYPVEASIVEAHAALLLSRAGAVRADLARGGDVQALIVLRAYGVRQANVSGGLQERAFLLGDLIIQAPGRGEVFREALAAKAADHYYNDGTRERRTPGRRAAEREPEPEPEPPPPAEVVEDDRQDYDRDLGRDDRDDDGRDSKSSRSRERRDTTRGRERRDEPPPRATPPEPRKERRSRSRKKRRREEAKEAKKSKPQPKRRNRRRRRQRQPLILE